ncbi:MAG TPA: MipA/OmpV family protein [Noviherbaspirillum sp.]|nr:MipA/OmpV family protein [Noviherbaspirillum sp.]
MKCAEPMDDSGSVVMFGPCTAVSCMRGVSMKTPTLRCKIAAVGAAMLAAQGAMAQGMIPFEFQEGINVAGLGLIAVPDYYGSADNEGAVRPIVRYWFGGDRYVQLLGPELTLNLVDRKEFRAGPVLRVRGRRDDDVDDEIVKRMRPIASTTELGVFAAYHMHLDRGNPLRKLIFEVDVVGNTGDTYNGATGNLRVNYIYPFQRSMAGNKTIGTIGLGMFFASSSFNRAYFGVTGSDVALFPILGGREHVPDNGLTSLKLPFSLTILLEKNWLLALGGRYERLLGDAKDSPIIEQRGDANQWAIGAALSYAF